MNPTQVTRVASLVGYFALLCLLMLWYTWLAPSTRHPTSLVLIIMVGPLLLPLRGLLYGRPYTHAWTGFLALLYFTHGVVEAWANPGERILASLEILFSSLLFIGSMFYARWRGRELARVSNEERGTSNTG